MTPAVPVDENLVSVTVDGQAFQQWITLRVTRKIDRMTSDFEVHASEFYLMQGLPTPLMPLTPVVVKIGDDVVLTGYIDTFKPELEAGKHMVHVSGRSKTEDLIDCMPDVPSGQFKGYTLGAIARALAAPFGITVVEQAVSDVILVDTTIERSETVFHFLERLCRLSAILPTDNELGQLVLSRTGTERATDALVEGVNVVGAKGDLTVAKRFSKYIIKTQTGGGVAGGAVGDTWGGFNGTGAAGAPGGGSGGRVTTTLQVEADDPEITRYRPHVSIAESALSPADMQTRVNWQRNYAIGRGKTAHVKVRGWRQSDGTLWQLNTMTSVTIPAIGCDQDMLIVAVEFDLSERGRFTTLTVGPPEGYTPDPGEVKARKQRKGRKGKAGGPVNWSGFGQA